MAVNLSKNRLALLTAYQDVIDEGSDTDWALYTYEEETNDLTLAASGGGGLAEITLTFDNSLVMYGFCSIKEPTAALPRYILINWVGDDVPDARKCACASHVAMIADFFQGVEVIVNASSLEDIEPSAIGQRLTNGTTSVASPVLSRLKTREDEHPDVGTVYEKTNAEMEMKKINREEFWEKAKMEEELRKEEERVKAAEERRKFEEERMELERLEQENREKRYREREREIEEHRKKLQEEEEAKERQMNQPSVASDPNIEDLSLDKKESEVEEAKAIIAQRSGNPREFFKQKERAMTICVDTSPVSVHRPDEIDETENNVDDDDADEGTKRSMSTVSPGPKTFSTATKEDSADLWDPFPKHESTPPVQDSAPPSKPVQSVAPQPQNSFSVWDSGTDSLVELWDTKQDQAQSHQAAQSHCPPLVELTGDCSATSEAAGARPQPLLSFDDVMDGTFCSVNEQEDPPMTLSYQHALQHAANQEPELDDGQLLMTNGNGDSLLKEGTQASEGYFSQSQEEEFGQTDESSAKATPIFYNKPPEIDITCWDTDPVVDDEDD
ncbi:LOW QUALITY PROTEIN: drebrin [Boleophthalmus pectinirostris]|uniref:LOW QUALITY PROTEIN: drebrin n=1 Tax=Boleophthalmus pectinirostris TaxID=150288 RepID=UPI00242D65F8|nr:LOW QUALITY PROTEIN: drebrin [Boleophthalmus pectinirostris]